MFSVRTRRKFFHSHHRVGNHSGVGVKTGSRSGFRAAVSIQPTGRRMKPQTAIRNTYIAILNARPRAR